MPSVVITGGTKGIGRSLIFKFAQGGFDIITCARNQDDLNALTSSIVKDFPGIKFKAMLCDVSKKPNVIAFGEAVTKFAGAIDILINNAGVFLPGQINNEGDGVFENQINTNLASAYHLTRTLLPGMIARKEGYIINMCSIASIASYPDGGSYTISKFALLGFSKALREELKPYNIRVSSVLPGAVFTASWDGTHLPAERFIDPDDLAELIFSICKSPSGMVVEEIVVRPLRGDIL